MIKMQLYRYLFLLLLTLFTLGGSAQNVLALKEKIANKYYNNMSYMQAIAAYEDIVEEDSGNQRVLPNLAYSYRKISDMTNAERIFAILVQTDSNNAAYTLEYAQLLAINKKYPESAKQYERYAKLNPSDKRSKAFSEAYQDETVLINKQTKVNVALVNFNSGQSDFSPTFYKKGLVFVSNRSYSTAIKRTFEWDQTAFLDLYYVRDTADIKKVNQSDTAAGKSSRKKIYYNDDDTRFTSNDSRTMGYIGYKYVDTSNMFVTPDIVVEQFSKKIKTKYHEGPLTFTADQKTIIFTRNNYNKGWARRSEAGVNMLKLYAAQIDDAGNWTDVRPLNINNNNYSVGHPTLASGDTILYFVSDMPGGIGGADIYKSYWRDNKWSTPENLGRPINTEGNELFPYIDKEGTLYFASSGHPGIGGLDLFKTSLKNPTVENLGIPLNSNYDDFGITLDENASQGYFSSNRRRGINDDDIYKVSLIKKKIFTIKIVDSLTNEPISSSTADVTDMGTSLAVSLDSAGIGSFNAQLWHNGNYNSSAMANSYIPKLISFSADEKNPIIIIPLVRLVEGCIVAGTVTDKDTKLPVAGARVVIIDKASRDTVYDYKVSDNGKYRYAALKGNNAYDIDVSKDGYFNKPAIQLTTKGNQCLSAEIREYDYLRNFELEQIIVGKAIKIDNIYFDLAKYNIRVDAAKELDKIVKLMNENPDIIIELSSHTDCRASYQYNMTLSDNRAKSSASYIISKGISSARITGKGYGETKLVNDCACEGKVISKVCTEEEHQANRRTEFQVTGFLSDKNTSILNQGKGATPTSVPLPR